MIVRKNECSYRHRW